MSQNEKIVANIDASIAMEGMPLTIEEKEIGLKCLNGELDFGEVIAALVQEYTQKREER